MYRIKIHIQTYYRHTYVILLSIESIYQVIYLHKQSILYRLATSCLPFLTPSSSSSSKPLGGAEQATVSSRQIVDVWMEQNELLLWPRSSSFFLPCSPDSFCCFDRRRCCFCDHCCHVICPVIPLPPPPSSLKVLHCQQTDRRSC